MATKAKKDDLATPLIDPEKGETSEKKVPVEGASLAGFKFSLFLAMRTAFMVLLCSLPIFYTPWNDSLSASEVWKPYLGLIPGGLNLMIVFTVYSNYGTTVQFFYQGLVGTALACGWVTVMSAIMPDGAAGDHYYAPLAHTSHIVFCVLSVWVNISANVRMFILSYHVYFAMSFMDPATAKGTFNTSWAFDFESSATSTLLTAVAGLLGALVVMLLPKPILAKRAARNSAVAATESVCNLMDDLVVYFNRTTESVIITQLLDHLTDMRVDFDSMNANINASWWETFDLISGGMRRKLLSRHVDLVKTMCDNMLSMQIAMAKEDFAPSHVTCMQKIDAPVKFLLIQTRNLLKAATDCAAVGVINDEKKSELQALIDETRRTIVDLGQCFNKTRREMFPEKVINPDLQSESFFVYCMSAYARHAMEFTYLMLEKPPPRSNIFREIKDAFLGIFDKGVLMARLDVHGFTVRGSLSVLGCYYVGMYYEGYNAVAAGTVSLLITDFAGSALQKNMGRIQAVVIGAVVPHILVMVMGTACTTFWIGVRMLVLFLFETITCYIYYSSPTYGYIGLLAAAFALPSLIYGCGAAPSAAEEKAFGIACFVKMTQTVLGVILMTCVDMVLASERASDGAQKNLLKAVMDIDVWLQGAFLERDATGSIDDSQRSKLKCRADIANDHGYAKEVIQCFTGQRQKGTIHNLICMAEALGKEANMEPRYNRAPWQNAFFEHACRKARALRLNLVVIENVLMGTRRRDVESYADFKRVRDSAQWEAVRADIQKTMGNALEMIQAILENETAKPMAHIKKKLDELEGMDKIEGMPDLFISINKAGIKYPADKDIKSMEHDEICRLNVLLMLFDSNVEEIAEMIKQCLTMVVSSSPKE